MHVFNKGFDLRAFFVFFSLIFGALPTALASGLSAPRVEVLGVYRVAQFRESGGYCAQVPDDSICIEGKNQVGRYVLALRSENRVAFFDLGSRSQLRELRSNPNAQLESFVLAGQGVIRSELKKEMESGLAHASGAYRIEIDPKTGSPTCCYNGMAVIRRRVFPGLHYEGAHWQGRKARDAFAAVPNVAHPETIWIRWMSWTLRYYNHDYQLVREEIPFGI